MSTDEMRERRREYQRKYYLKNKESVSMKAVEWAKDNQEKVKAYRKKYYLSHRAELSDKSKAKRLRDPLYAWACGSVTSHRNRGHVVDMTAKDLVNLALKNTTCQLCGVDLYCGGISYRKGENYLNSITLDRLNNEKVINKGNVLILCNHCNMSKGLRTLTEFIEYCRIIASKDPVTIIEAN